MTDVAPDGRCVLVVSFADRSGIRAVWGPFPDTAAAATFEAHLKAAELGEGDLWEVYSLRSMAATAALFEASP